jgi:hypothetical protein
MPPHLKAQALEFRRDDPLRTTRVVADSLPEPGPGSLLLRIERFTLTSNNVTYARHGDALGYWTPFPAGEPGWGRVPAWGAARVVAGDVALAAPGELLIGFLPMATHVFVRAEPRPSGVRATAPERSAMVPLYRDLMRADDGIGDTELAVRLGTTATQLAGEVRESKPAQVVFSSATSRTALTTAVLLRDAGIRVVGLTARTDLAARAEAFDEVRSYADIDGVSGVPGTVYVDVAGRADVTAEVHRILGAALVRSIRVGATHPSDRDPAAASPALPGPSVERFNVGTHRIAVADRIGEPAMEALERESVPKLAAWAAKHLAVERFAGLEQARQVWQRLCAGEVAPMTVVMIDPAEPAGSRTR